LARQRQRERLLGSGWTCNAEMDAGVMARQLAFDERAAARLARAYASGSLSARGRHRLLRVARTVADLAGHRLIGEADLVVALSLHSGRGGAAGSELAA
jgi:magnesium chelatase family protein